MEGTEVSEMRPTPQDRDALELLLADENLSDWAAGFVESLANWNGPWTEKQANKFDERCEETYG